MEIIEAIKELSDDQCIVQALQKAISLHECLACGKCVFGYEGAMQLNQIFKDMAGKKSRKNDLELVASLCSHMKTQSLCEAGLALADTVLYALDRYGEDIRLHQEKKDCPAGICSQFMTFHILAEKCTGCGDCLDACDDDAIVGKKRFIHVIDQDECILCGNCLDACEEGAIVKAGSVKPRCPKKPVPCRV